ncbi:glycine--tRNA ligase subunit beta [Sediminibacillus massiliensis]|uniref:glycine--tRNA ligase subunit beta n=1 Tax=Sediminibacillus massiliensis TaxID=1926277 RepID=UPI000988788F|nr:glycine--tRNA ligase subunit beta [Sediminibacillus massiliensis]
MVVTNILFEIGLEEMPARFLNDAESQLEQKTKDWLTDLRIPYSEIVTYSTPRRLAVLIKDAAEKQPDIEEEARGPAKKIALDDNGEWSKAAVGFSKGQGMSVDDIYMKEVKGTEYIFVNKFIKGDQTVNLLPGFKEVILSLNFPKNMRWGNLDIRYARPIRWMAALFGREVIPMEIAGVTSSNVTYGHRFLGTKVQLDDAINYPVILSEQFVLADPKEREARIVQGIKGLEEEHDWNVTIDDDLLDEVRHLVEYPTVFYGGFDEEFLTVPEEALVTSMKEHQRYFPVRSKTGELLPYFIGVRNGDARHLDKVAKGNEKVLKARLSDARFFYEEDQKQSIEQNLAKLSKMVFQEKLGTIADKVQRVVKLTREISSVLKVDEATAKRAERAAEISKFDLVTNMVNEFTELQGIMGEKYARLFGEEENTAVAINEHYMPRSANGKLPETREGSIVSVADKLDTIVGCISVGIIPTGSQDPYALRRQALGILQIIKEQKWSISLEQMIDLTYNQIVQSGISIRDEQQIKSDLEDFFGLRASYLMKEKDIEQDVIDAVLTRGIGNYHFAVDKASVLTGKRADETFKSTQEALVRVLNLAGKGQIGPVNEQLFENDTEKALYSSYLEVEKEFEQAISSLDAEQALIVLAKLTQPIHQFFDHTMVMAEDEQIRDNRLHLLNQIAETVYKYADLRKVQWKQQF